MTKLVEVASHVSEASPEVETPRDPASSVQSEESESGDENGKQKSLRALVLILALFCAATRLLALSRTYWDWDEAQFLLALRDYDVTQHHPHPPGFPAYIAMGKLARIFTSTDFHALQAVNLLAAILLFPALYLFARALRLRFSTSVIAALLFAFFPNVWFFGGGAFSDIPSITIVLFAVTLLLRGRQSPGLYFLGTLLLAIAVAIRPQNLLLGLVPGLMATRKRRPLEIVAALLIGVVVVSIAFGVAIHASGSLDDYMQAVREHGDYIARVDSWRSTVRPPLWRLFDRFFIKQYQSPPLSFLCTLFVIASVWGSVRERNRAMLVNVLTFAPFAVFAWLMLDRFSISRFSIGYQPMFAILAADGVCRAARFLQRRGTAARPWIEAAITAIVMIAFIVYTLPALGPVRNEESPPIMAVRAVAQNLDPKRDQLFVGHTMSKFVDLELPRMPYVRVIDDRALPLATSGRPWLLTEITKTGVEGLVFRRERGHLWNIARRHYFDVKLAPIERRAEFGEGWYAAETSGIHQWRWMSKHAVATLPAQRGDALLRMHLGVPTEVLAQKPTIEVRLNGATLERFQPAGTNVERDYRVAPAPRNGTNALELFIDRTTIPRDDSRQLGMRLRYLAWGKR